MYPGFDYNSRVRELPLVLAIALVVAIPRSSVAQSESRIADSIVVTQSDDCVTQESLVNSVAAWLGKSTIDQALQVIVRVETRGLSFELTRDGVISAERHFDVLPSACPSKLRAVSLAIAIAIDQRVLERVGTDEPSGDGGISATDVPPTPENEITNGGEEGEAEGGEEGEGTRTAEAVSSAAGTVEGGAVQVTQTRRLRMLVGAGLTGKVLPGASFAAEAGLELLIRRPYSLRLGVLTTNTVATGLGMGRVDTRLIAGQMAACRERALPPADLGLCLNASVGVLRAQGAGYDATFTTHRPWSGVGVGIFAQYPRRGSYGLRLKADVIATLLRPRIHVTDTMGTDLATYRSPAYSLMGALELFFAIW